MNGMTTENVGIENLTTEEPLLEYSLRATDNTCSWLELLLMLLGPSSTRPWHPACCSKAYS
jgi:hypothetical protein